MKKFIMTLSALALLFGMTNCRKNLDTIDDVSSNGVYITLNVDDGQKVHVNPTGGDSYATVDWETDDILYVGNNGAYCGYLRYDGSKFGGTINPTSGDDGDYLHFYFMGNKGTTSEPTSVNITDQTSKYPVISYGRSTSLYNSGTTSYSARLLNKCAIMKFNTTDIDKVITITGMNNTVAVNFAANGTGDPVNPYTYSKSGSGVIRLHAESNTVRWAILLPQDEVATATAYAAGYTTTNAFSVPAVSTNGYYDSGVDVNLTASTPVDGAFTINTYGDQVIFSPGNLQYIGSAATPYWKFAGNQWDYFGTTTGQNSANANVDRDLFGWGTSGYNHGANCYQPYSTSETNSDYYAYGSFSYNLYDQTGQADWGSAANAASLGGYTTWRTLKSGTATGTDEWLYIFNTRTTGKTVNGTDNARYTMATINTDGTGVNGMILFPDSYAGPTSSISGITFGTINNASKWETKCTTDGWATLEDAGCVFLPASGSRRGVTVTSVGTEGNYWSSSCNIKNDYTSHHLCFFNSGYVSDVSPNNSNGRRIGFSVRLVRPVD